MQLCISVSFRLYNDYRTRTITSGGAGGIAVRGQIYMAALIGVVEIHLQLEIADPVKVPPPRLSPFAPPLTITNKTGTYSQLYLGGRVHRTFEVMT